MTAPDRSYTNRESMIREHDANTAAWQREVTNAEEQAITIAMQAAKRAHLFHQVFENWRRDPLNPGHDHPLLITRDGEESTDLVRMLKELATQVRQEQALVLKATRDAYAMALDRRRTEMQAAEQMAEEEEDGSFAIRAKKASTRAFRKTRAEIAEVRGMVEDIDMSVPNARSA